VATMDGGDAVGHVVFTDKVLSKSQPSIGKQAVYSLAAALSDVHNYGGDKDLRPVVVAVNAMLKQRALIVLVSDFLGMPAGWERYIRMLGDKFDLLGIMIRDPLDTRLPRIGQQFVLEDPYSNERIYVDVNQYGEEFERLAKADELRIQGVFDGSKAGLVIVRTDAEDILAPILAHLQRRNKMVRE
jgi:hypothetical protein